MGMKLKYSTTETRILDDYNKSWAELIASAKAAEDEEYDRLRKSIPSPYDSDMDSQPNFIRETIDEMVFNSKRKKAHKAAHKKYLETVASFDPKKTEIRDKAYSQIKLELCEYGYSMAYLGRLPECIVVDLYRSYLLDKYTGFAMPIEAKLEGHMNAIISNVDHIDITASNFFSKASDYTHTGHMNAYYAPARVDIDKFFVCPTDEAFKYSVACRQARFDFFESIDHRRMAAHTPVTEGSTYKQNLARVLDSGLYDHTETSRRGKNPYSRLLSLKELGSKLMYEDIAESESVRAVKPVTCGTMTEFYRAYIDYLEKPSHRTRSAVLARVASADSLASSRNLRCSTMGECISNLRKNPTLGE